MGKVIHLSGRRGWLGWRGSLDTRPGRTPEIEALHTAMIEQINREMGLIRERCGAGVATITPAPSDDEGEPVT